MKLTKNSPNEINLNLQRIFGFMIVKNESLRLPYILDYYRGLEIDQFIIIDNGSSDGTLEILNNQEDVSVFSTTDEYGEHWPLIQRLLSLYGLNRWCLVLDADEMLFYPHCDIIKLHDLCKFLDDEGGMALHCILLDTYSKGSIKDVRYKSGENPLKVAPWFDSETHHKMRSRYYGGMRERVFGITPCITKYPLFRFNKDIQVSRGMHEISIKPTQGIRGALLHFKYMQDFYSRAIEGSKNGQYWNNSFEYKAYAEVLGKDEHLNLWYPKSVKFSNNEQLIKLGIEETSDLFEKYASNFRVKRCKNT